MIKNYSQIRLWLEYIAICAALAVPVLTFAPLSSLGFELPKFFALSVVSVGICIVLTLRREAVLGPLLSTASGTFLLTFFGVTVLSLFWSVAPLSSLMGTAPRFQGVLTHVCFAAFALGAMLLARNAHGRHMLLNAIIITNAVTVSYGFLQMVHLDPLSTLWQLEVFLGRVFSFLGHPNALGQFIVLTVPFTILAYTRASTRVHRLLFFLFIILNAGVLLATVSRSALLGVAILIALGIEPIRKYVAYLRKHLNAFQAFVFILIVTIGTSVGFLFFAERFSHAFEIGRSSRARAHIWSYLWNMFEDRPLGWGLETLAFVSPRFTGREIYAYEALTTVIDRAHNEVLQILVTLGPIGLISFLLFASTLLITLWQCKRSDDLTLLKTAGMGVAAYLVTLLFGFPTIATGLMFWVVCGLIIGVLPVDASKVHPYAEHASRIVLSLFCIAALLVSAQWAYARVLVAGEKHTDALLAFGYDRQMLINTAQLHVEDVHHADAVQMMLRQLSVVTGGEDGMVHVLSAWSSAVAGDVDNTKKALYEGQKYYFESMTFHRAAEHILRLIGDEAAADQHHEIVRILLPDGFFDEESELHRILEKQHPWVSDYE